MFSYLSWLDFVDWLISYFGFNDPLRQYFSLYRAVSQRGRKKRKKIGERKKCSNNPLPHLLQAQQSLALLFSKLVGRSGSENLPSTITPPPSRLDFDDSLSLSLSLSLCENNKLFGFILMSRKFIKMTLWHKLEIRNKLKREVKGRKVKEGKKRREAPYCFSLLTAEIVKLTWTSMQGVDHIAPTLKR